MSASPLAAQLVTWDGTGADSNWATGGNWDTGSAPGSGNDAVFDADNANSKYSISLGATRTVNGITFNAATSANGFTLGTNQFRIGSGGLTNDDDQTQTFNIIRTQATQTWDLTGGLIVSTNINMRHDLTINGTGNVNLLDRFTNNAALTLTIGTTGGITTNDVRLRNTLTLAGSGDLDVSGSINNYGGNRTFINNSDGSVTVENISLSDTATNRTLTMSGSSDTVVSGIVSDGSSTASNLTKTGAGNLTFEGANNYDGATNINAGTLTVAHDTALGTVTGSTTVAVGAELSLTNNISIAEAVTNNGTVINTSGTNSVGGVISGSGGLNVIADQLTLTADNTYTGTTNVDAGRLIIQAQTRSATMDIDSGAVLEFNVAGGERNNIADTKFTGSGTLQKTGAGTMRWGASTAEFALDSGALIDIQEGIFRGGSHGDEIWTNNLSDLNVGASGNFRSVEANVRVDAVTGSGIIETGFNGAGYSHFTIGVDNGDGDFSGVIQDHSYPGNITKIGTGTQTFSGLNTYSGDTVVENGTLIIAANNALGSAGTTTVQSGATLGFQGGIAESNQTAINIAGTGYGGNGAIRNISGSNTINSPVVLSSDATINSVAGNLTIAGTVSGSGNTLTKNGAGTLTVTANNTYDTLNITAGTFALGTSDILADSMDINLSGTGTFSMSSGTETIDQLTVAGSSVLDVDGILTMNGGTISGGSGSGSTGELILTAGNTLNITNTFDYGGTLELTAGTILALSGDGSQIDIGTLRVTGDTVIDFGTSDNIEFNLGSLEITNNSIITVNNWTRFQDLWTTSSFTGSSGSVSLDVRDSNTAQITFTGFSEDDTIWVTLGNEITVPEPSSYGALLMAFGLAGWLTRRRPRRLA